LRRLQFGYSAASRHGESSNYCGKESDDHSYVEAKLSRRATSTLCNTQNLRNDELGSFEQ
jgi:hypothetical protein